MMPRYAMAMIMTANVVERGTLYFGGGFAYRRTEARQISYEIGQYAQFEKAIQIGFTRKGCRKPSKQILTSGQLVLIAGWGHQVTADDWTEGKPLGPISTDFGHVTATVHQTRYQLGDPRWIREFDEFLENYLRQSAAQLLWDFRRHDFKDRHGTHLKKSDLTPEMPVLVTGVIDGQIVPVEHWPGRRIPSQEFETLAEAQEVFPDLDLRHASKRFVGPLVDTNEGRPWSRFDSLAVFDRLSR